MDAWSPALLLGVGLLAGFVNVLAGGGSLLVMPALVFLGFGGPLANGTTRLALLAQNITAVTTFRRGGHADFRLSLTLAACALPGAALGAFYGTRLDGPWFDRVLAAVMVAVIILMSSNPNPLETLGVGASPRRRWWGHLLMAGAGLYGGFIQAGVGFIIMPILHRVLGLDLVRVNMHKVFIIGSYTLVALGVFAWHDQVHWRAGALLAASMSLGGWLGTRFALRRGSPAIRVVLQVVLAAIVLRLLIRSA